MVYHSTNFDRKLYSQSATHKSQKEDLTIKQKQYDQGVFAKRFMSHLNILLVEDGAQPKSTVGAKTNLTFS